MNKITRYDQGKIESYSELTKDGFLKCKAVVTRCGIFEYKNADGSARYELRPKEEVFNRDSLETMKMIPLTNNHPLERLVTPENSKKLSVGYTGQDVDIDTDFVYCNFVVTDAETIDDIVKKGKTELSLGYTVDLEESKGVYNDVNFDYIQKNIQYNHLSIVNSARAGGIASIKLDENDNIEISLTKGKEMTKRKVKLDEDFELMLEDQEAAGVERLVDDLKNLKDEKARVEEELKMITEKLERAMGERDAAKEEAEKLLSEKAEEPKNDSKKINERVKERIKLIKFAETVVDSEDFDEKSDLDIKKLVIKSKYPNCNLDGKGETYLTARFDAIVEDSKGTVKVKTFKSEKTDSDIADAEKARLKMIEDQKNAYKKGSK